MRTAMYSIPSVTEIQGEHREKRASVLQRLGYKVKVVGG
jgi:translation initiation factor 1 (eIF-1/SUI1)